MPFTVLLSRKYVVHCITWKVFSITPYTFVPLTKPSPTLRPRASQSHLSALVTLCYKLFILIRPATLYKACIYRFCLLRVVHYFSPPLSTPKPQLLDALQHLPIHYCSFFHTNSAPHPLSLSILVAQRVLCKHIIPKTFNLCLPYMFISRVSALYVTIDTYYHSFQSTPLRPDVRS